MTATDSQRFIRVLLTGQPGIGKTTICKKLVSLLQDKTFTYNGFYTEEIRNSNSQRIGFDVISLKNADDRLPLARISDVLKPEELQQNRVGNYNVFIQNFEKVALSTIRLNTEILIIDEIGKMELFSKSFQAEVENLFFRNKNKVPCIIATIPQTHKIPQKYTTFFQKLRDDTRSEIINVDRRNRDSLPEEIVQKVIHALS